MRPFKTLFELLMLAAVSGSPAEAAEPGRSGYDRMLLLQRPGQDHRALGLIKAGLSPDFGQPLPSLTEPLLMSLLEQLPLAVGLPSAPARLAQLQRLYSLGTPGPFTAADYESDGPELAAAAAREQQRYRRRLIENLWSVKYLIADPDTGADMVSPAPQAYQLLTGYGEPLELVVIEKRYYLPRFYFRTQVLPVNSFAAFAVLLGRPGAFRPFQQVVIENPRHLAPASPDLGVEQASQPQLQSEGPERLELRLQNAMPGYLVLAEPWRPDWRVWLDGRVLDSLEIEIANGYQGAVWLEPGEHQIAYEWPQTP